MSDSDHVSIAMLRISQANATNRSRHSVRWPLLLPCPIKTNTKYWFTISSVVAAWSRRSRSSVPPTRIGPNIAGSSSRSAAATCTRQGVSVAIVDLVTTRNFNLYADLLALIGVKDPMLGAEPPSIYASACRWRIPKKSAVLEAWSYKLEIGQPLPTLPIWLADDFRVPLELEPCYEETCRVLRIP